MFQIEQRNVRVFEVGLGILNDASPGAALHGGMQHQRPQELTVHRDLKRGEPWSRDVERASLGPDLDDPRPMIASRVAGSVMQYAAGDAKALRQHRNGDHVSNG